MPSAVRPLRSVAGTLALAAIGLAGCGADNGAYCAAVGDAGAVKNWSPERPEQVQQRLAEVIEVAPSDVKPLWEEFAAGFEELVNSQGDLDQVNDTTSELRETASQIDEDIAERCA